VHERININSTELLNIMHESIKRHIDLFTLRNLMLWRDDVIDIILAEMQLPVWVFESLNLTNLQLFYIHWWIDNGILIRRGTACKNITIDFNYRTDLYEQEWLNNTVEKSKIWKQPYCFINNDAFKLFKMRISTVGLIKLIKNIDTNIEFITNMALYDVPDIYWYLILDKKLPECFIEKYLNKFDLQLLLKKQNLSENLLTKMQPYMIN